MHIDKFEKLWIWISLGVLALMFGAIFYAYAAMGIDTPSNVETIDSTRLHLTEEFAEDKLGVKQNPDGSVTVTLVAARYAIHPQRIEVPVDTPVTFRIATPDVLHGLHIQNSNMDTMVVPGYVSQISTAFPQAGEYPMFCNEFCGLGHHYMWSKVVVVPKRGA